MLNKIKIGQTVSLTTAERKLAHFIAKNRNGNNRSFNVTNLKISAEDAATVDLPLYDAVIPPPPGFRIDVKTTKYDNGKLLVDSRKGKKTEGVDFYALMTGSFPGPYTFRGFIAREQIIQPHKLGLLCGYNSYMAEQSELTDELPDPPLF